MSKLSEMIQAAQTNERRHVMTPTASIDLTVSEANSPLCQPNHYVYDLKATFGCTAVIQHNSGEVQAKLKAVRRQVVDHIFGEFREDIYAIERALFDYDTKTAQEHLNKLMQRMFDV